MNVERGEEAQSLGDQARIGRSQSQMVLATASSTDDNQVSSGTPILRCKVTRRLHYRLQALIVQSWILSSSRDGDGAGLQLAR